MKSINQTDGYEKRADIVKSKRLIGMIYGITGGLAFAISSWGQDGYILNQAHAYLPWLGLGIASIFCVTVGGTVGWLAARTESSLFGTFFWTLGALLFAWLVVALPLQLMPFMVSKINPQWGELLNYQKETEFMLRFSVALMWIMPFVLITGVAQLPITESSVFSTSFFGKIAPTFFCIVVMGMSGFATDNLINLQFRDPIVFTDRAIQFVLDNQGNPAVDKKLARAVHATSFSTVQAYVTQTRHMFVRSYDDTLGDIHVLIKFDQAWVDCDVIYNQPVSCKLATEK